MRENISGEEPENNTNDRQNRHQLIRRFMIHGNICTLVKMPENNNKFYYKENNKTKAGTSDTCPSRAGWRADFLLPFDPTKPRSTKELNLGKIGDFEIIKSQITFDDIGGNYQAKRELQEIAHQLKSPEEYAAWDVPIPKGVLLHGEPGNGKTLLAKAFANEANASFLNVRVALLRSAYYGETEQRLSSLFDAISKHKSHVIVFFDEIESLLPNREKLSPGNPDSKIVNVFLEHMDGIKQINNVTVLGASNQFKKIDNATLRPGRFDQKIEIKSPNPEDCSEIVARQLLLAERTTERVLVEDNLDFEQIGKLCKGLCGADIAEAINRLKRTMAITQREINQIASRKFKLNNIEQNFSRDDARGLKISTNDILAAIFAYKLGSDR